jgi:hypothetical protein
MDLVYKLLLMFFNLKKYIMKHRKSKFSKVRRKSKCTVRRLCIRRTVNTKDQAAAAIAGKANYVAGVQAGILQQAVMKKVCKKVVRQLVKRITEKGEIVLLRV